MESQHLNPVVQTPVVEHQLHPQSQPQPQAQTQSQEQPLAQSQGPAQAQAQASPQQQNEGQPQAVTGNEIAPSAIAAQTQSVAQTILPPPFVDSQISSPEGPQAHPQPFTSAVADVLLASTQPSQTPSQGVEAFQWNQAAPAAQFVTHGPNPGIARTGVVVPPPGPEAFANVGHIAPVQSNGLVQTNHGAHFVAGSQPVASAVDGGANFVMAPFAPAKGKGTGWNTAPYGKGKSKGQFQQPAAEASFEDIAFVESFLATIDVQEHAKQALRVLPPNVQKLVISKGNLDDARDQTAVLLSRIQAAQAAAAGQLHPSNIKDFSVGDWICPGCMDHQFQRNAICRKCGTPNPNPSSRARGKGGPTVARPDELYGKAPAEMRTPEDIAMVENFLANTNVHEYVSSQLRQLPVGLQRSIISKGSLNDARDQNAVLISRIAQAKQAAHGVPDPAKLSKQNPQDGDWFCPGCHDLQFRRNPACRRCGTPNPGQAGVMQQHQQQLQLHQQQQHQLAAQQALAATSGAAGFPGMGGMDPILLQQHLGGLAQYQQAQAFAAHAQVQAQAAAQAQAVQTQNLQLGHPSLGAPFGNMAQFQPLGVAAVQSPGAPNVAAVAGVAEPAAGANAALLAQMGMLPSV